MEKQQSFVSAFKESWNKNGANGPSARTVKPKLRLDGWIAFAAMSAGRLLVVLATLTLLMMIADVQ
jgi:hypothetical protein